MTTTGLRPVEQMIADIVAAGGRLEVDRGVGGYWENLVASANRHHKVPDGMVLTLGRGDSYAQVVLVLSDAPHWMMHEPAPVPVAITLRRPHHVIAAVRDDPDRLVMKKDVRLRALRLLDALAHESERRGYRVSAPKPEPSYGRAQGLLEITISGHDYIINIDELTDRVPHTPTAKEVRDFERASWNKIPTHHQVPSGRLRIRLTHGWTVHRDKFADTKATALEDHLAHVLLEIELRAAAAEEQRARQIQKAEEARVRWEQVHAQAKIEARESHRAEVLLSQVAAWKQAHEVAAYLVAAEDRLKELHGSDRTDAEAWLRWSKANALRFDPLTNSLRMPEEPEYTADTLRPFMQGLSPHGPSPSLW